MSKDKDEKKPGLLKRLFGGWGKKTQKAADEPAKTPPKAKKKKTVTKSRKKKPAAKAPKSPAKKTKVEAPKTAKAKKRAIAKAAKPVTPKPTVPKKSVRKHSDGEPKKKVARKPAVKPKAKPKAKPKPRPAAARPKRKPSTASETGTRKQPAAQRTQVRKTEPERDTKDRKSDVPAETIPAPSEETAREVDPQPKKKPKKKLGFFARIAKGLKRSSSKLSEGVTQIFTQRKLDDDALEELEDLLISSDLGTGPASRVISALAKDKFNKQVTDPEIKEALANVVANTLTPLETPLDVSGPKPQILLFVGVNGSGKTTTLGKIAAGLRQEKNSVLIVAGDTFRAAAIEQIEVWGERAGAEVMSGKPGADAAGLVYDAISRAKNEDFDAVLIDTAGRLQNRTELMAELEKIVRVIKKQDADAPHHVVLVLDATVGQNALSQAEAFQESAQVSGLIMTKLDGTAKGGVLVALADKYQIPIHYIGIGERIEDLERFSGDAFARALAGLDNAHPEMDSSRDSDPSALKATG